MDVLKISLHCLQKQEEIKIDETISSDFLDIDEKDLKMNFPIQIKGKAYLSNDFLVINFSAKTQFQMPCSICNEFITEDLAIENYYETIPLSKIKSSIYDYTEDLRQALILKLPQFIECNSGHCPERKNIEKYIKK